MITEDRTVREMVVRSWTLRYKKGRYRYLEERPEISHPQTKNIKKSMGWRFKAPAGLFPSLPAAQTLGKFNSFTTP